MSQGIINNCRNFFIGHFHDQSAAKNKSDQAQLFRVKDIITRALEAEGREIEWGQGEVIGGKIHLNLVVEKTEVLDQLARLAAEVDK